MKIEMQPQSFGLYRKPAGVASHSASVNTAGKQDVIDFRAHPGTDKALNGVKAAIQSNIAAPSDPRKIEALRAQVASGSYYVSTDAIVDSIMGSAV